MLGNALLNVRKKSPLIENITNYVTVNDCANILLACGASPIMADDKNEVEEIVSISSGVNINIGTLGNAIEAMFLAGKKANELSLPVVLDPVGAGASKLRTETSLGLIREVELAVIRGNASEIKTLAGLSSATRGVDVNEGDRITKDNLGAEVSALKAFAKKTGAIIASTGEIDIVCDSETAYCIYNGHPDMETVTGTGCQLSAMTAAYVAANPDSPLEATAAAVCAMGLAGEIARKRFRKRDGNATYRNYIIDAIYNMTPEELRKGARYEVR